MEEQSERIVLMSEADLQSFIKTAVDAGIKAYKKEKDEYNRKLARDNDPVKKTREALEKYRKRKRSVGEKLEISNQERAYAEFDFWVKLFDVGEKESKAEKEVYNHSKQRAVNIYNIERIERAVELYRQEGEVSGNREEMRRCREISMMYMTEEVYTAQQIAEIEKISEKTVYRDLTLACKEISAYYIGM